MTEERMQANAEQIVEMIMTAIRYGTPKEAAERNMADRLDISRAIPDVNTAGWSDEAQQRNLQDRQRFQS